MRYMREISKSTKVPAFWSKFAWLFWIMVGVVLGCFLSPVEKVFVDPIVVRRVEVPVERVVERTLVGRVEPPARVQAWSPDPYASPASRDREAWSKVRPGITRQDVVAILGPPDEPSVDVFYPGAFYLRWGSGTVTFHAGGRVNAVSPP